MLVLTRKPQESICIGDGVRVTIVDIRGSKVRLGIEAPPHVRIHRQELAARGAFDFVELSLADESEQPAYCI
jgi:carbon storage regulator